MLTMTPSDIAPAVGRRMVVENSAQSFSRGTFKYRRIQADEMIGGQFISIVASGAE